jgi:hypothetical protein
MFKLPSLKDLEIGNPIRPRYSKNKSSDFSAHSRIDDIFAEIRKYANQITNEAKNKAFQALLDWTDEPLTAEVRNKIRKHRKSKYNL